MSTSGDATVIINDRYEIHKRVGRGGMADVFLARDRLLDRQVAIKVLFPEFAVDPNFVERFRREAQAAANLSHPNIVNVYDWGKYEGTYFIAMEYVQGRTLAEILKTNKRLTAKQAAAMCSKSLRTWRTWDSAAWIPKPIRIGRSTLWRFDGLFVLAVFATLGLPKECR